MAILGGPAVVVCPRRISCISFNRVQCEVASISSEYFKRNLNNRSYFGCKGANTRETDEMPHCFVSTCSNYYGRTRGNAKIKYHMLPTSNISEKWIELCGYVKGTKAPSYARVCSIHFSPDCYQRDLQHELLGLPLRKKLRKEAVPDQQLPTSTQRFVLSNFESLEALKDSDKNTKETTYYSDHILKNSSEDNRKQVINSDIHCLNQNSYLRFDKTKANSQSANIINHNELSPQKLLTTNLDEAFQQFQTFLESTAGYYDKQTLDKGFNLEDKTSTPKTKLRKSILVSAMDKMGNINKQKCIKQKHKSNQNNGNVKSFASKTLIKENKKESIKNKLKNDSTKKKFPKDINVKIKNASKIIEKNNGPRISLDENLLKQILNVSRVKNDSKVQRKRRKTSDDIPDSSGKRLQTKSNGKVKTLDNRSNSASATNKVELCRIERSRLKNTHEKEVTTKRIPIYNKINKTKDNKIQNNGSNSQAMKSYRFSKLPIRSSFRIAKKKSIESLSDSFTYKINHSTDNNDKRENFADKLKFMAKLQLKFGKSEQDRAGRTQFMLTACDPKLLLEKNEASSLQKMRIMDDVREGCMVQPSSPGHAELRPDNETAEETCQKSEDSQNDAASEYCDQLEVNSVKEEMDVKSPNIQCNNAECEPNNTTKRRQDEEDTPAKRLRADIEENFRQRDKILNEFMDIIDCDNATTEQLHVHSEQLLSEIKAMNELAREKEMEWNNIIHLKKMKEELLIRIERKKQISMMNGDKPDSDGDNDENRAKLSTQSFQRYILSRSPKADLTNRNRHILPKPAHLELNGSFDPRQGIRNRPTLDVQSIIADYRQRHPEAVPRRGRRIRNSHNGTNGNSGILNFSSMALGSGSQMKHNLQDMGNELNMLLSVMDASRGDCYRPLSAESSQNLHDTASFKDILVQFAKLSQNERNELLQNAMKPPPPYPEVTVHPVTTSTSSPTNSLLHGILTKSPSKANNKTAFSPTLARLLTAPERAGNHLTTSSSLITSSLTHPSNMSISEILSTSKARNEITITPVDNQFDQPMKNSKCQANAEDDETEDSADRLVIDESNEEARRAADNNSDAGDEVPQCQGCNQKIAQFVCAGCGNQWYCSRDCQVAAWDEHSEVCSG